MPFGQFVIGPPGSGKSTYCNGLQQFLPQVGRKVCLINLDPANDTLPYKCDVDVMELITLDDVMDKFGLGPNGGLMYCIEYLVENLDWLLKKLKPFKDRYMIFDCPGQVELYTHHAGMRTIVQHFTRVLDYRLCAVHLVDSHHCNDAAKFVSVALVSLAGMIRLELPHVNVLSKMDLIEQFGKLAFGLEFYTDMLDLEYLVQQLEDDPFLTGRFSKLNHMLAEVVQDYSLVSFATLDISDKFSVDKVVKLVDKANGYVYGDLERSELRKNKLLYSINTATKLESNWERVMEVQERYMNAIDPEPGRLGDDKQFIPSVFKPVHVPIPVPINIFLGKESKPAQEGKSSEREEKSKAPDDQGEGEDASVSSAMDEKMAKCKKICSCCLLKPGPLRCGRCKRAFYCSQECQRNDWTRHKAKCSPPQKR